jgi:hypothetical protein
LVSAKGLEGKKPFLESPTVVTNKRMPPTRTVNSGAVIVRSCAMSMSLATALTECLPFR